MNNHKEEFLLERLVFFSDAVFAIIITLLVIEIRVPEVEHLSDRELFDSFLHLLPKLNGMLLSFFVIGLYWVMHHKLFSFVTRYHKKLLWYNLLFLLPLIIMPFSTAFLSEYFRPNLQVPLGIYTVNILFTGIMSFRLWNFVTNKKYNLSTISHNEPVKNYYRTRALVIPSTFVLMFLLSFITGWIPFLVLPFVPFITYFIRRYYSKKYPHLSGQYF